MYTARGARVGHQTEYAHRQRTELSIYELPLARRSCSATSATHSSDHGQF